MKVVLNNCYGGYGLSEKAQKMIIETMGIMPHSVLFLKRNNTTLIEIIEKLGKKANGPYSKLKVIEIPDGCEYLLEEYGGLETIKTYITVTIKDLIKGFSPTQIELAKQVDFIKIQKFNIK